MASVLSGIRGLVGYDFSGGGGGGYERKRRMNKWKEERKERK